MRVFALNWSLNFPVTMIELGSLLWRRHALEILRCHRKLTTGPGQREAVRPRIMLIVPELDISIDLEEEVLGGGEEAKLLAAGPQLDSFASFLYLL
jgi:hypothetical protein